MAAAGSDDEVSDAEADALLRSFVDRETGGPDLDDGSGSDADGAGSESEGAESGESGASDEEGESAGSAAGSDVSEAEVSLLLVPSYLIDIVVCVSGWGIVLWPFTFADMLYL